MFGHTWYFSTIRKYVILFGTLFNDVRITREDKDGNVVSLLKVPLSYAPKEKILARFDSDPEINRPYSSLLPRMSFEMSSLTYDGGRKLHTIGRTVIKDTTTTKKLKYQYNPVPYNFNFKLYIYVKNAEDATKIAEQILPFFTPDWTTTVKLIPEMNINMDIPVVLDNISIEDSYDGNFAERRALVWTIDFTLKGYIYGPVKKGPIIKYANTVFYAGSKSDDNDPFEYTVITPGLTANGTPTSNASLSISIDEIEVDDDFGYIVDNNKLI